MKAAHKNKVKKIVITGSVSSIAYGHAPNKTWFDEDDWSVLETCDAYSKSKTLAEKAAWDYVNNLPEAEKFDIVMLCPSHILGPNLNSAWFSSGELVKGMMLGYLPMLPKVNFPVVDVRNVAEAHV